MTHNLSNRKLLTGIAVSLCTTVTVVAVLLAFEEPWTRPGSTVGQSVAIVGASLLALSAFSAMFKRVGTPARRNFTRHIWLACIGFVLVTAHTGGNFLTRPALLLLALLALMGLGVWARTSGAQQMAATFGSTSGALSASEPDLREQLKSRIERKRSVLARMDSSASEATFSLVLGHWFNSPAVAFAYHRLVREERVLLGTDQSVGMAQAYWRRLHRIIAVAFIVGLLVHIVLVTFFAGYVAEGRAIYWWHLAAWDF